MVKLRVEEWYWWYILIISDLTIVFRQWQYPPKMYPKCNLELCYFDYFHISISQTLETFLPLNSSSIHRGISGPMAEGAGIMLALFMVLGLTLGSVASLLCVYLLWWLRMAAQSWQHFHAFTRSCDHTFFLTQFFTWSWLLIFMTLRTLHILHITYSWIHRFMISHIHDFTFSWLNMFMTYSFLHIHRFRYSSLHMFINSNIHYRYFSCSCLN